MKLLNSQWPQRPPNWPLAKAYNHLAPAQLWPGVFCSHLTLLVAKDIQSALGLWLGGLIYIGWAGAQ